MPVRARISTQSLVSGFGSGCSGEFGCCGVVEEPGQGPVDAGQVSGEQQRSGRRVRVADACAAFEEAAEIDQMFFDRGARQRFAGAGAGGGRDPDLEVFDVVAFELGARADPAMVLGQRAPEDTQVLFDVLTVDGLGPFVAQVGRQRVEEPRRDRHDPLVTALAHSDEHSPLPSIDVLEPQPEHLTTTQPSQQHRVDHRLVPMLAKRVGERIDLGRIDHPRKRPRCPDQRHATHRP